ncbi:MAG: T9SS type A sorting domain-containing protein [bacterium]
MRLGGPDGFGVRSIDVSPSNSNLLMCAGADWAGRRWLSRTTNGGMLWVARDVPDGGFFKVVFDTLCPGRVFARGDFFCLWVSEDSGATFRRTPEPPDALIDFNLDPFRRDWLWGIGWSVTRKSFVYSPDAGSTWVIADTSFPPDPELWQFVRVSFDRINTIYATGFGSVFQTTDGGQTWRELSEGWPTLYNSIDGISVVAGRSDELWAGLSYHGILSYTVVDTSDVTEASRQEPRHTGFYLYPEPASSVLYLSMTPQASSGTFSLYNILGQRVLSVPLSRNGGVQTISLPGELPSGTYFGSFASAEGRAISPKSTQRTVIVK